LTAVTTAITAEAARLQGRLLKESITAAAITDTASAAYLMCADVLTLIVAIRVARDMTGADPALAKRWQEQVTEWFDLLEKDGATFLGDESLQTSASDPDGPTDFIEEYGLSTGNDSDASSAEPYLRRDDKL
jgi:hypothetical protein